MYWSLENVPWTNLHDLNLDWIVNTMKQTVEQWIAYRLEMDGKYADFTTQINSDFNDFTEQVNSDFDNFTTGINNWKTLIESEFSDLQTYVQNYFDNLDLNESTRYVINQMIASGEFVEVLNPSIVSTVESWLAAHITPTTPVVDDTLTIAGAAADAKTTGDRLINKTIPDSMSTAGYYIDVRTGSADPNVNYGYWTFKVIPGTSIVYFANRNDANIGLCFYNKYGDFISGSGKQGTTSAITIAVPANANTCKASHRASDAYVYIINSITPIVQEIANLIPIEDDIINRNVTNSLEGYFVDIRTGALTANMNFAYFEFAVVPNDTIEYNAGRAESNIGLVFYDYNNIFISGVEASANVLEITVPTNAFIARAAYRIAYANKAYVKTIKNINTLASYIASNETLNQSGLSMFRNISFIGDSYTQGGMKLTTEGSWVQSNKTYPAVIGGCLGVDVYNYGVGGATAESYLNNGLASVLAGPATDLYIISLGINDAIQNKTIGDATDLHEDYTQNPNTFIGNMGKLIGNVKTKSPNGRIIIIGEWHWNSGGVSYMSYLEAARVIASTLNIPFINPFDDAFFNSVLYRNTMVSGHPNQITYTGMAFAVMRLCEKCIISNIDYFRGVGFTQP